MTYKKSRDNHSIYGVKLGVIPIQDPENIPPTSLTPPLIFSDIGKLKGESISERNRSPNSLIYMFINDT